MQGVEGPLRRRSSPEPSTTAPGGNKRSSLVQTQFGSAVRSADKNISSGKARSSFGFLRKLEPDVGASADAHQGQQ